MLEATQNVYLDRTTTWHSIGKSVTECSNVEQVLQASGLDYTVEKRPVFTYPDIEDDGSRMEIPNRFVTVRRQDGHVYDIVSDKYEMVQNRDAFDFVNYMGDEISFEKAGETASGMIYIIAKLPDVDVLGDKFTPHVIFRNGFTGKINISAAICPLRIVCQNQFNFAFKDATNTVNIRHVANAEQKLVEAREILVASADYMAKINSIAEQYAGMKLSELQLRRVLEMMFPLKDIENANPFKRKTVEEQRAKFIKAYEAEDNRNFKGTGWGLINAYTDFITHKEPAGNKETRFEGRFTRSLSTPMNQIITLVDAVAI